MIAASIIGVGTGISIIAVWVMAEEGITRPRLAVMALGIAITCSPVIIKALEAAE